MDASGMLGEDNNDGSLRRCRIAIAVHLILQLLNLSPDVVRHGRGTPWKPSFPVSLRFGSKHWQRTRLRRPHPNEGLNGTYPDGHYFPSVNPPEDEGQHKAAAEKAMPGDNAMQNGSSGAAADGGDQVRPLFRRHRSDG